MSSVANTAQIVGGHRLGYHFLVEIRAYRRSYDPAIAVLVGYDRTPNLVLSARQKLGGVVHHILLARVQLHDGAELRNNVGHFPVGEISGPCRAERSHRKGENNKTNTQHDTLQSR